MDWLLTVPLLLLEILLVMKLDSKTLFSKGLSLGVSSAVMIIIGYPGELILNKADLPKRWGFWAAAMVPFLYIVYELTVGLANALNDEEDDTIKSKIWYAQRVTIVSWLTYPIVYIIPMMMGARGPGQSSVVGIQMGYCVSDIISKCGVGLVIYQITAAKSKAMAVNEKAGYSAESQPLLAGAK
jgi:bacteriorhodopsin